MRKSINSAIQRHEILRTTFTIANGQPQQVIHLHLPITVSSIELAVVNRLTATSSLNPFDFA